MAACNIFEEDEVYKITRDGVSYGLVLETAEYTSSDEEEDNFDNEDRVKKGSIRVAWHPDGSEEIVKENEIKLADRSLMPGDVVRRLISGENSQRGYVKNMKVSCHLQVLGTQTVICDVDSLDVLPIQDWDPDPGYVTLDSWVGRILFPQYDAILRFSDGARVQMPDVELTDFCDVNEKRDDSSEFGDTHFYRGQVLEGGPEMFLFSPSSDLEAKWLTETKVHNPNAMQKIKDQNIKVTVEQVITRSLEVQWMCRGYARVENPNDKIHPPPRMVRGDDLNNLRKLECFEHCSLQIGDKCYYKIKEEDQIKNLTLKKKQTPMHFLHKGDLALTVQQSAKDRRNRDKKYQYQHEWDYVKKPETGSDLSEMKPVADDRVDKAPGFADTKHTFGACSELTPESALEGRRGNGCVDLEEDASSTAVNIDDADEHDDLEDGEYDDFETDSDSVSFSGESDAAEHAPSKKRRVRRGLSLKSKNLRKKMTKRSKKKQPPKEPRTYQPGELVPAEVIYTLSEVEVVWQDSTVESGISSPDLYPIHHLDELEFFPGDFVIDAKAEGPQGQYGVVMSVDHTARTCIVKWVKPYQVGKGNRPDELIEPDEVSVYDIKDHPDYKFRPDQVIVRVGGYEDTSLPMEAAGQIYEIHPDGSLEIQWANGSRARSYPQEIFLVSDEMSEMGSSEYSSTDDEDDSMCSWETEAEETQSEQSDSDDNKDKEDDKPNETRESDEEIPIRPEDKVELDQLLDKAKNALEKLEGLFSIQVDISPQAGEFYKNILHVYRNCQDLDRILGSSFFSDPDLITVVSKLRKEVKKEKRAKMTQQVLQLFEQNLNELKVKHQAGEDGMELSVENGAEGAAEAVTMSGDQCAQDGGVGNVTKDSVESAKDSVESAKDSVESAKDSVTAVTDSVDDGVDAKLADKATNGENKEVADSSPRMTDEDHVRKRRKNKTAGDLVSGLMAENVDITLRMSRKKGGKVVICVKQGEDKEAKSASDQDTGDDKKRESGQSGDESDALLSQVDSLKARELCERACHCLKEQIQKVQNELDKIWQKKVIQMQKNQPPVDLGDDGDGKELEGDKIDGATGGDLAGGDRQAFDPEQLLSPLTPDQSKLLPIFEERFSLMEETPEQHRFKNKEHQPQDTKTFFSAVKKEIKLLRKNLPAGIKVKGFEDRMDLYSILIVGPSKTPYEDGLFLFDVQLPSSYPTVPPAFHYMSFCSDRMNPNLYEDGKVCVSLLGTWGGKGTELWNSNSTMLQVLISIQGLILNAEPYYNEAGFERQRGTQQGMENSKVYNEMAILKLVESMTRMVHDPPIAFKDEIINHLHRTAYRMICRLTSWIKVSQEKNTSQVKKTKSIQPDPESANDSKSEDNTPGASIQSEEALVTDGLAMCDRPEFPLLPASRGLCITLEKRLERFKDILDTFDIREDGTSS